MFKIQFEILNAANTMDSLDCNDPDLKAFASEFNLRQIFRARELVELKTAALVSNLFPNASDPQMVGVSSKEDAETLNETPTAAHYLISSLIRTIHWIIIQRASLLYCWTVATGQQGNL